MAALALTINSLLVPLVGRRYVIVALGVSSIHLFTFGPLSLLGQSGPAQLPTIYLIFFVIVPVVIALISIFVPASFFMKKKKPN